MHFDSLGELSPDRRVPDWMVSQPVPVPLLGGIALAFTLEGVAADPRPDEFAAAVRSFLALRLGDRDAATPHVFENYERIAADWGLAPGVPRLREPADVWACVHPGDIHVSRRHRRDQGIYVQVLAECDWEPEHGPKPYRVPPVSWPRRGTCAPMRDHDPRALCPCAPA